MAHNYLVLVKYYVFLEIFTLEWKS